MLKPIGEVLNGIEILPLDDGDVAIEGIFLLKTVDSDGHTCWVSRHTVGPHDVETLGVLHAEVAIITKRILETFVSHEED